MSEFKIGDVVRHKASGDFGPAMSVNYHAGDKVICTYWHDTEKRFIKTELHPSELVATEPPKVSFGI